MASDPIQDVEIIWNELGVSVRSFVRRRVSDPHDADDVVAEVMLRIHRSIDTVDDRERVTAWVFRVARNAITDYYRHRGRRAEVVADESDATSASGGADEWLDDPAAVLAELAVCVRPLVGALPADARRALELTDLEGLTQSEAARIEGVSVSGMKSRVQRGRRQFAAIVQQCCEVSVDSRGELMDFRQRSDDACAPGA